MLLNISTSLKFSIYCSLQAYHSMTIVTSLFVFAIHHAASIICIVSNFLNTCASHLTLQKQTFKALVKVRAEENAERPSGNPKYVLKEHVYAVRKDNVDKFR